MGSKGRGIAALAFAALIIASFVPARGAEFTIKMASPSSAEDNCIKGFFLFEKLVEERTNGRVDIQVMHSAQLGDQRDNLEGLQMGSLQVCDASSAFLSGFDSKFMVFDLPYISKGVEHMNEVLHKKGLGQKLSDSLEEELGIKIIGWVIRSPRCMYSSRGPINTAADFEGLKVRIMESPVMTQTFTLLGAVPVPISASERYMALQTKVVDAAENAVSNIMSGKEYEVTKYLSLTEHFNTPNVMAMSAAYLNSLPEDIQKIIVDTAVETTAYASELENKDHLNAAESMAKLGMIVNAVADKSSFIEKVTPIYDEYRDEIGGDIIDYFLK